jgi:hypothetical protein
MEDILTSSQHSVPADSCHCQLSISTCNSNDRSVFITPCSKLCQPPYNREKPSFWFMNLLFRALSHKSQKLPVSFGMSGRLYQLHSHTDFRQILCRRLLRKSVQELQIWLKSDKFTWRYNYVFLQHYEIICNLRTMRRQTIVAFPCQQSTVLYCWQL